MIQFLKDYFPECIECGTPHLEMLCEHCAERLRFRNACVDCGRFGLDKKLKQCAICEKRDRPWNGIAASFFYEGGIRDWILEIKDANKPERLSEFKFKYLPSIGACDFLVPVTSDPQHIRKRGYNVAELLAAHLGKISGIKVLSSPFERMAFLSAQKELDEFSRRRFLKDVLRLRSNLGSKLASKRVLLVDDVMTTGASLQAHARLLRLAGAEVTAFCLARTPRYH